VYDAEQGVIWAASDNGSAIDWNAARSYCAGKGSGWNLPTVAQLRSLYDLASTHRRSLLGYTIDPATPLIRFSSCCFWSSETSSGSSRGRYFVSLYDGRSEDAVLSEKDIYRALCVRRP
jgi:hypothetical protein